ncbi:hypothetical protein ACWESM_13480 [Nocardia sp. NPDC003999]
MKDDPSGAEHERLLKVVAEQLNIVRDAGLASLDTRVGRGLEIPVLLIAAESLEGCLPTFTSGRKISLLLREQIKNVSAPSHRELLTIIFGLLKGHEHMVPDDLRKEAVKRTSYTKGYFIRKGGPEDKALDALAAQIISNCLSVIDDGKVADEANPAPPEVTASPPPPIAQPAETVANKQPTEQASEIPRPDQITVYPHLADTARQLAQAVRKELHDEAVLHQLHRSVIPVRWRVADDTLTDHWEYSPVDTENRSMLRGVFGDVVKLYSQIESGRLVILGSPGSGKTTMVRDFSYTILGKYLGTSPPNDPGTLNGRVPVIFNLSSWDSTDQKIGFIDWLASVLVRDHPGLEDDAKELIAKRILPILEGLDEMDEKGNEERKASPDSDNKTDPRIALIPSNEPAPRRKAAMERLKGTSLPFVLTCRIDQYRETVSDIGPLPGAWAIELESLEVDDIEEYLSLARGTRAAASKWRYLLNQLKERPLTDPLREAFTSPLMVSLASAIYVSDVGKRSPERLLETQFEDIFHLQRMLFSQFVASAFPSFKTESDHDGAEDGIITSRKRRYYDSKRVPVWLNYTARNLENGELKWWELANKVPRTTRAFIAAILLGLVGAIASIAVDFNIANLSIGLAIGSIFGFLSVYFVPGEPPIGFSLLAPGSFYNFVCEIVKAPIFGLAGAMTGWLLLNCPLVEYPYRWLTLPIAGIAAGLTSYPLRIWLKQAHSKSWSHETALAVGGGVGTAAIIGAVGFLEKAPIGTWWDWFRLGLVYGLFLLLAFGPHARFQVDKVANPSKMIANSRSQTIYYAVMTSLAHGVVLSFIINPWASVALGISTGIATGIVNSAWGRWAILTRGWLALTGKMPRLLVSFLDDAHRRGILRQSGAVYLFRHKQLERYILEELP